MADMDVAVGIGRAIMEDELLALRRLLAHAPEQAHIRPALEQLRLLHRQARLHRKVGLGQENGVAVTVGFFRRFGHGGGLVTDWIQWGKHQDMALAHVHPRYS